MTDAQDSDADLDMNITLVPRFPQKWKHAAHLILHGMAFQSTGEVQER